MDEQFYDLIVIGGGAAGFFAALSFKAESQEGSAVILEKTSTLLGKVKISGGGRCNVTHHCFEPLELVKNYPRGNKALIGPFSRFQPRDTMQWFTERGVSLKVEDDRRVFPITDNSQTIIDCLTQEAKNLNVSILLKQNIESIEKTEDRFQIKIGERVLSCKALVLATGSHPQGHRWAAQFGHTITPLVPSLFTFNIPDCPLKDLSGIVVKQASIKIHDSNLVQEGPILVTHWGLSGPAVLKLSAWGAPLLHQRNYQTEVIINWVPKFSRHQVYQMFLKMRAENATQNLTTTNPFELPKNLWKRFLELCSVDEKAKISSIGNRAFEKLSDQLTQDRHKINGKTTNKEEFVTCGGIALNEVNFKTMESTLTRGLYFAGEILDIDGVTGGFNFQNSWTTGWLAGKAAALCV